MGLGGPATTLPADVGFYPLSRVITSAGAMSAGAVFSQLARENLVMAKASGPSAGSEAEAGDSLEQTPEDRQAAAREDLGRWFRLELPAGSDLAETLAVLGEMPEVELAEPVYEWRLAYEIPPVIEGLPDATTDPAYDQQWFHNNAKIWQAWNHLNHNGVYPGGSQDVVVAVIDSGVDYHHEDLAASMWVNPGEIPGNGIDDDGNGFVDDIHGVSVVGNPNMHSGDPMDQHGHGTHVAGIIAAQGFNEKGGVGVAFNTRIMAIRAAQYSGVLTVDDVAEGILYAVDNGADVINMSFGGYSRSQIIENALEMALNQAVLVAAAGNDGLPRALAPMYPAALPYVLGVEATTPSNGRADFSNSGYEIGAPGASIYSTLPGDQYAAWSGTSMATPVVSGIAALMRSYYWQRDVYSSRFIMGSIAASGNVVDAYKALTEPPQPGVRLYDTWLFDDPSIDPANDGDGRIDSGETVHLAVELINRSGMAENVTATLRARAPSAVMDDPYVTILTDTVSFGNIGPFAIGDNGLIWNHQGVIIGVEAPFVVHVDPGTPNDHVISFVLTTTFQDGWHKDRPAMTRIDRFEYIVQRGQNLPTVISQDMTLTADNFWIVGGPVLVEQGATLRIEEGTMVQWGAISSDPYNPGPQTGNLIIRGALVVQGSAQRPVSFFPSYLVSGQRTNITVESEGRGTLEYVKIRNPNLTAIRTADHVFFDWDAHSVQIDVREITNSVFHRLRGTGSISYSRMDTSVFSAGRLNPPGNARTTNSVFLQDNESNHRTVLTVPVSYHDRLTNERGDLGMFYGERLMANGDTYVTLPVEYSSLDLAETIANYYGGHVASAATPEDWSILYSYLESAPGFRGGGSAQIDRYYIGLSDREQPNHWEWLDGSPTGFANWAPGQPAELSSWTKHVVQALYVTDNGRHRDYRWFAVNERSSSRFGNGTRQHWQSFILRLPGEWTAEELAAPVYDGRLHSYVKENFPGDVRHNAFLSKFWDPSINRWMQIRTTGPVDGHAIMYDNYWGTDNTQLIDYKIHDYYDTFTLARVEYGVPPSHGYESTYPFVQSVSINGMPAHVVPEIGAGPATFEVTFNRPMDPNFQPFVTFGPSPPHTDFRVHPLGGNDAGYNRNTIDFTVTLSLPASRAVTVDYATRDHTAVAGVDYQDTRGTLVFAPGEIEKTISIPLIGNIWEEPDHTFFVDLSDPTVAVLGDAQAVGTILDDDPSLAIDSVEVIEGDSGTTDAVFTVRLSKSCDDPITVHYATVNGSARAGVDYQPVSGMLTFEPGMLEKTVTVPVFGNTLHQPDRNFFVELTHPTRVSIAENRGEGIIIDDDPLMSIDDVAVVEGDSGTTDAVFTVRLSSPPLKTITVDYATANRTAMAGEDYLAQSGTLTFLAGESQEQTIVVSVLGDTKEEPNETFVVNLSNVQGAVLSKSEGIGTIITDDGLLVAVDDVTVVEGDGGRLDWSTFLGGSSEDMGYAIAIDGDGNAWVTGATSSAGWTSGGFDTTYNGGPDDMFLAKISSEGQLLWSTYLGGSGSDQGRGIAIDDEANIWITGATTSPGWISGGFNSTYNGGEDAFVVKLDPQGQILWSTYLGGSGDDRGLGIAVDADGDAWITGRTGSDGWVSGGFNTAYQGGHDGFVAKVSADGQHLWSTYLGGANEDYGRAIAIDGNGNGWVVGQTHSSGWTAGGFQTTYRGGWDGFVASITPEGELRWSTYLGGSGHDYALGVAADPAGGAWIVGQTHSTNFPREDSLAPALAGGADGFLTRLDDAGQVLWSGYLPGGPADDVAHGIALDAAGDAWVAGRTRSSGWTSGGFDSVYNGGDDGFVMRIAGDGSRMLWSSYLGGSANELVHGLAADSEGRIWLVGETTSDHWTSGGFATRRHGPRDAFVGRVYDDGITIAEFTISLSEAPDDAVTVQYTTSDGTAVADEEYEATSGVLTFLPEGPLQQPVFVRILGDLRAEQDEQFYLDLISSSDGFISFPRGTGTILNDDPLISIDDVAVIEGDSGTVDAVFTVSLSVAAARTIQVDYATQDQTATAGLDYQAVSGTLVFAPGETEKTITVPVYGDLLDEDDETFLVVLSSVVDAEILNGTGVGTILDDDPTLSVDDVTVVEGDDGTTDAVFTVSLSSQPRQTVTVRYRTVDDTATAGEDYLPVTGRLVFEPGHPLEQTVHVPVVGDTLDELDETFLLELFDPTYATLQRAIGVGTILDDDPKIRIDDVAVLEGDSGTTPAVFTVSLSAAPARPLVIDYHTTDGTATASEDYQAQSGTLTFEPGGPTEQTISITVYGDTDWEPNETFFVHLTGASHAEFIKAVGQGTIIGDDGPFLAINDVEVVEGDQGITYAEFLVTLSDPIDQEVRVDYATAYGTATAGEDYYPVSGTLVFPVGGDLQQTILVPIIGDLISEGDETFYVDLFDATVVPVMKMRGVGTILDDDPMLSIDDVAIEEGDSGTREMVFTVSVSQPLYAPVTVDYATQDSTAIAGVDYLQAGGTLTFEPNGPTEQPISVYVIGNTLNEPDRSFTVQLSNATGTAADPFVKSQGVGTILDDDGPKLVIEDASLVEGDSGQSDMLFTVRLTEPASQVISINFATEDITARAGLDYLATSGTMQFEVGETEKVIAVPVLGDLIDEPDEQFRVMLSGDPGVPLLRPEAIGTIIDDDTALISIADSTAVEGSYGWINDRTWRGAYWVTPMTGESYHLMRISGAVAADDPWLVSGHDVGRFRFQVKTMGVAAMTLQATGQEGSIRLTWAQDDFDLLAGYHLYRATSAGGTYTRLNNTIIPVGQEWFVDTDVQPAVTMYYKFTVVQTDMSESDASNVASAAALDTIPPTITHTPKPTAPPGAGLRLTATITDNVAVLGANVHYRPLGSTQAYVGLPMTNTTGDSWSVTIPGLAVQPPGVEYYLTATDGLNTVYHGTPAVPHSVIVTATPNITSVSPNQGSFAGGTRVTVSGAMFQTGATVKFGSEWGTDVVVQTGGQILVTTPPHFPALVDVRVINPDDTQAVLLNGYQYVDDQAVLSLPTMTADHGAIIEIPISLAQVEGLRGAQFTVTFDSQVIRVLTVGTGTLTSGWFLEANTATPGRVTLSMAGFPEVSGSGTIARLNVEVIGAIASQTALNLSDVLMNDGAIQANLSHGSLAVHGFFTLGGNVRYYQGNRPVPDASLDLVGVGFQTASSDALGAFSFPEVQTGTYTLTPGKEDQVTHITAYDASLILRASAGLLNLSANQRLAADVNNSGTVTALDASYVLQKSVGLLPGHFPGAGRSWLFLPDERSYPLLNGDLSNQDFTAILIGDVSGNWEAPAGGGGASLQGGSLMGGAESSPVELTVPNVITEVGQSVTVPLQLTRNDAQVHALDLKLSYDASQLTLESIEVGSVANGMMFVANTDELGMIRVGMAGSNPLPDDGDLLVFSFQTTGSLTTPAPVLLDSAAVDEGAIAATVQSGYVAGPNAPGVTVWPAWTGERSPALTGKVGDASATVTVTVDGNTYMAQNLGDGTWSLPADMIDPPLDEGTYDVHVHATDVLMRVGEEQAAGVLTISDQPGSQIEMRIVKQRTATDDNGGVTELPTNAAWVHEWQSFWAEIFVSTASPVLSISEAVVDLQYSSEYLTVGEIEHGPAFTEQPGAVIDPNSDLIRSIGGATLATDLAQEGHVLLARVRFTANDAGVPVDAMKRGIGPYGVQMALADGQSHLAGGLGVLTALDEPAGTELWAVMYDIDDNNQIDFGDFSFFAAAFGKTVAAFTGEPPYVWWADFDKSGRVDFGDLAFFAPNFGKTREAVQSGEQTLVFPSNFPEAWRAPANGDGEGEAVDGAWMLAGFEEQNRLSSATADVTFGLQTTSGALWQRQERGMFDTPLWLADAGRESLADGTTAEYPRHRLADNRRDRSELERGDPLEDILSLLAESASVKSPLNTLAPRDLLFADLGR